MKFKKLTIILLIFLFNYSCSYDVSKKPSIYKTKANVFYSGFVLVYDVDLYNNKIIRNKLSNSNHAAIHPTIKKNTYIQVTNPENNKSINVKVVKNGSFPNIYKLLINKKTANYLDLKKENPFIEFYEIKNNKKFISKKAKMFEEEKKVALEAPVKSVEVVDISTSSEAVLKKKKNYYYVIIISDFYYKSSADELYKELNMKKKIKNLSVQRLKNNKFRLSSGPFNSFVSLKDSYSSLYSLGFDELNIVIIEK